MPTMESQPSDEELYRRWAAGDAAAGSRLVDRHLGRLARFFVNKVSRPSDAEELVGTTFEIIARKLGDFAEASSFRAYLYGVAHNVLRNHLRGRRRNDREIDPEVDSVAMLGPSPVTLAHERREHRLLLEGLRQLPLELQVVLEMSYFEAMSRSEIAAALELPEGTVASRMRRAVARLQETLARLAETPELLQSTLHGIADWAAALRERIDAGHDAAKDPG